MFNKNQRITDGMLLSDHMPFLVEGKNVSLLCWNILYLIKFNKKYHYFNSGFKCDKDIPETETEYNNRTIHVAAQLGSFCKEKKLPFLCLQECPKASDQRNKFIIEMKKNCAEYEYVFYRNADNDADSHCFLMTFFNANEFELDVELTNQAKALNLKSGLAGQVLLVVFRNKTTNATILVANTHADFDKEMKSDLEIIHNWTKANVNDMVLLGDCNRDLVHKSDNYSKHDIQESIDIDYRIFGELYVHAVPESSFITKAIFEMSGNEKIKDGVGNVIIKDLITLIETRDGCISSFPVVVTEMVDINKPHPHLQGDLFKGLTTAPQHFLEKLQISSVSLM